MENEKESRIHPRARKDRNAKAKGTKRHEPKVDYDRRDHSWIEEQDWDTYQEEE